MNNLKVRIKNAENNYSITVVDEFNLDEFIALLQNPSSIFIITDTHIGFLYKELIEKIKLCTNATVVSVPEGESSKNIHQAVSIQDELLKNNCDRKSLCIAFGGGVVGDLVAFVAGTYMRGIQFIHVPTSLLAMVDSSIGGKSGVNAGAKNIIGITYHPIATYTCLSFLKTLNSRHIYNGLFEIIKIFLMYDKKSLIYLMNNLSEFLSITPLTKHIIQLSMQHKISVIEKDVADKGLRMLLNFGHTIGHAIEKMTEYNLLHGYAVAIGMRIEANISYKLGYLSKTDNSDTCKILKMFDMSEAKFSYNEKTFFDALIHDKKNNSKNIMMVLIKNIGEAYIENDCFTWNVEKSIISEAVLEYCLENDCF